jgi:hypothetical protein
LRQLSLFGRLSAESSSAAIVSNASRFAGHSKSLLNIPILPLLSAQRILLAREDRSSRPAALNVS